jgi:hypothetical protein
MDNLQRLDAVAAYKFGVLTQRPSYLKFKDEKELYVLTADEGKTALITLMTRQGDAGLHVNDYTDLELEEGKIYYLKPAPPPSVCLDAFDVQKYALVYNLKVNAEANDQFAFITERVIDCLKMAIGDKKLRMSCWPFKNVNIDTFLEKCGIPYHLVIEVEHVNYIFDKNKFIETDCDDNYPPEDFFEKIKDVSTNGNLFCDCKTLVKVVTYSEREHIYNGSSITWGSTTQESELEKAFIIFNPDAESSDSGETILPVSTPDCIDIVF